MRWLVALGLLGSCLAVVGCDAGAGGAAATSATGEGSRDPQAPRPSGAAAPPPGARTVYVPAYSHLPSEGGRPTLFAITLSVRNVDPVATVTLTHVDYYDTSGHRVREYLQRPRSLRPLETAEFTVETFDDTGGSGANFLVYWEGPPDAHALLTETVMIGHIGASHIAFTSRGVELDRPPALEAATEEDEAPAIAP